MTSANYRLAARIGALLLAAIAGGAVAPAAVRQDDDLARRTFANAEQLMREGKIEQALRDYEQISSAYPDSGMADDALYRIGAHYYPADTVDDLGRASRDGIARAAAIFRQISTRYPREETAPRALYKLGLISMDPANPRRDLDEAYASFSAVVNIYPGSDVADLALFGAGYADYAAGRYDKSVLSFQRVAEEDPAGKAAETAGYYSGLALARQGDHLRALEELQAVRTRHPGGRLAERALDRLTQIWRLRLQPGIAAGQLFAVDTKYAPALDAEAMRGPVDLAVDAEGIAHVLDARSGTIYRLGPDGKIRSTGAPLPGATSLSVDAGGAEILAAGDRIRVGAEVIIPKRQERGVLRPFSRISAATRSGPDDIAMLDEDRQEILIHSRDAPEPKVLYRDPEGRARFTGLAAGADGRLYTIDRRGRRIIEIVPGGQAREVASPAGLSGGIQEPVAIAADDLGTLFVADRRAGVIVVMTTDGKLISTIASQPGTPSEFAYPAALAAGPAAELYLYDERRKTILRFR